MSMCIRPVVETWGESFTYSGRETDIDDLLVAIAEQIPEGDDELVTAVNNYNDLTVFYVSDGARFLGYLDSRTVQHICDGLAEEGLLSPDQDEYARQRSDIKDLCAMAASWRKSIDPQDGSLRIYCD